MNNPLVPKHDLTSLTRLSEDEASERAIDEAMAQWFSPFQFKVFKSPLGTCSVQVSWPKGQADSFFHTLNDWSRFFFVEESGCDPALIDVLIPQFVHVHGLAANEWTLRSAKKALNNLILSRCQNAIEQYITLSGSLALVAQRADSGAYQALWRMDAQHVIRIGSDFCELHSFAESNFMGSPFFVGADLHSPHIIPGQRVSSFVNNVGFQINCLSKYINPPYATPGQFHQFRQLNSSVNSAFFLSPMRQFSDALGLSEANSSLAVVWLVLALRIDQPQLALELIGDDKAVANAIRAIKTLFEPAHQDAPSLSDTKRTEIARWAFHQHLLVLDSEQVQNTKLTSLWCELLKGGEFSYPLFNKKANPKILICRPLIWGGEQPASIPAQLRAQTLTLHLNPDSYHLHYDRTWLGYDLRIALTTILADMLRESLGVSLAHHTHIEGSNHSSPATHAQNNYKTLGDALSQAYFNQPWRYQVHSLNQDHSTRLFAPFEDAWSAYEATPS